MKNLCFIILLIFTMNCASSNMEEVDIDPPSPPTNLRISSITHNATELSWEPATDENEIAAYHIIRDGVEIAEIGNVLTFLNQNLTPSSSYEYKVKASDIFGNISNASNVVRATTLEDLSEFRILNLPKGIISKSMFSWDKGSGILTFLTSVNFSIKENSDEDIDGFYWEVPSIVSKVIISANVTVTGGFRFRANQTIEGASRSTSIIYGTTTKNWSAGPDGIKDPSTSCTSGAQGDDYVHDCEKWKYSAVSVMPEAQEDIVVEVKNLMIENARAYAVTAQKHTIVVDNVHILNSRIKPDYHSNSDGFGAGPGSIIRNSKIDTWDDAIKLYRNMTVENVTIIHNNNGAPFQLGWGDGIATSEHFIQNVLIVANNQQHSNLALFSASLTEGSIYRKILTGDIKAIYGSDQEIRTSDPIPLFWLKSPGAILEITAMEGSNVHLSAPGGLLGPGSLQSDICGENLNQNNYVCGDPGKVTGCGW